MNIGQNIKNKIGNKLHFIYKRLFANHQYNFYLSRYRFNNVDDKTLNELKYFSETKYCWETCSNRLWLLYITILLENNENEPIDILVKKYLYFYGLKNVEELIDELAFRSSADKSGISSKIKKFKLVDKVLI